MALYNLECSDLSQVDAHICCLERSNLQHAKLVGSRFWKANFTNAILTDSELTQANIIGANLCGAIFINVKLGTFKVHGALTNGVEPLEARKLLAEAAKEKPEPWRHQSNALVQANVTTGK